MRTIASVPGHLRVLAHRTASDSRPSVLGGLQKGLGASVDARAVMIGQKRIPRKDQINNRRVATVGHPNITVRESSYSSRKGASGIRGGGSLRCCERSSTSKGQVDARKAFSQANV